MGGHRCHFRNCPVSNRHYPRMHFFHFPVKDTERYLKWLEMADCKRFLNMPIVFQRNRVVCARHFRDEYFMNYKKDRLIARMKVVPTLMRLTENTALDYADLTPDGLPKLITLPKPKDAHLIPPPDFQCPLQLDKDTVVMDDGDAMDTSDVGTCAAAKRSPQERTAKASEMKLLNKIKIVNFKMLRNNTYSLENDRSLELNDETTCERIVQKQWNETGAQAVEQPDEEQTSGLNLYEIQQTDENHGDSDEVALEIINLDAPDPPPATLVTIDAELPEVISKEEHERVCQQLENILEYERSARAAEKAALMTRLTEITDARLLEEHNALTEKYSELQRKYAELQITCAALKEQQQQQQQQVATVSTSKEIKSTAATVPGNQLAVQSYTKVQLFNGIKKYLCASMVALVRMEMFGHEEREWKADERRLAMELLSLGENVYRYLSDEWRCRLPTLRQVRSWHNEKVDTVDDAEEL